MIIEEEIQLCFIHGCIIQDELEVLPSSVGTIHEGTDSIIVPL